MIPTLLNRKFPVSSLIRTVFVIMAPLLIAACAEDEEDISPLHVRSIAQVLGYTDDPTSNRILPSINDPKAQLGKKLFFTKGLGGDQDTACASCHHPVLGGGDRLSLSIGVGAENEDLVGPGRVHDPAADGHDGGPTVPRNAPTTFNIGLLDRVMNHDGTIESLGKTPFANGNDGLGIVTPDSADIATADPDAGDNLPSAQARFPVTSEEQMRGFVFPSADPTHAEVRTALETRLSGYTEWQDEFTVVYGDPAITYARIAEAIAEYERSQVFVNTPWKAFMADDDAAISEDARRGALLFMLPTRAGGVGCVICHRNDMFTDELFHVLGMPQIGRGLGDGTNGTDDFGRFRVTANENDKYAFRTPSLLNVTETGPWGHAGAYTSLEAVVRHHLDPQAAFDNYDVNQLEASIRDIQTADIQLNTQNALDKLAANRLAGIPSIQNATLTDEQVGYLLAFLQTLTDPCVTDRACLAPWIPDADDANPDSLRLEAVDSNLDPL